MVNGEAHGMVLTSNTPMSASNWLNAVTLAELTVGDTPIPGSPVHKLDSANNYGELVGNENN